MKKPQGILIFTAIALASCATVRPIGHAALVVRAQTSYATQTSLPAYTQSSINHLTLKLFTTAEQDLGISKDLLNAQLDNPITFANLKPNTTYRIRAYAYRATGTNAADLISIEGQSYLDVTLTNDDRPTLASLPVKLMDRAFDGQATSSLTINNGGYSPVGSEAMRFLPQGASMFFVGASSSGYVDGTGTNARFSSPMGVAIDSNNNIFMSDCGNQCIRKITPSGVVTTFAGQGTTSGFVDGTGSAARFSSPYGITIDSSNNLYVADQSNHAIRKITPAGVVTTLAGNGSGGSTNGTGTQARFTTPTDVKLDAQGNLLIADFGNHLIRKIDSNRVVTTLAGCGSAGFLDGTGTLAAINGPVGLALDKAGNLYFSEFTGQRIRKMSPSFAITTIAGNGTTAFADGQGSAASFKNPVGIAFDLVENLYVTDYYNNRIRKITPSGMVSTLTGNGTTNWTVGTGITALTGNPRFLAFDATGTIYSSCGTLLMKIE